MWSALFALSLAALPTSSAPASSAQIDAAERLANELSKDAVAVVVDDTEAATARCHANRLVLTPASLSTFKALTAEQLPTTLTLSATRHGVDAKQRRCTAPTTITVDARARRPLPAAGTSITIVVVGEGFQIDAAAVVIACRRSDQHVGVDVVCARTATGRVLTGILDERGVVVVAAGSP